MLVNKKKMTVMGIVGVLVAGAGVVGVKAYPHIQSYFIKEKYGYTMTSDEKKEMDTLTKQIQESKSEKERIELYEKTKVLRESVAQLTPERTEDQEYYRMYLENGDRLKTDDSGELFYQYQQDSRNMYDILQEEIKSLKSNLKSIQKEYKPLQKEHKGTEIWKRFADAYYKAENFIDENRLNVEEKQQIENELLKTYMELNSQQN